MEEFEELQGTERDLADLVLQRPAPGKHAARSAIYHIVRAFRIENIDPEMALFRAITAEEEAARAIFDALQRRKYSGAEKIKWWDHRYKAAVMPFLLAVGRAVKEAGFAHAQVEIREVDDKKQLAVHIQMRQSDGEVVSLFPHPPLHLSISVDGKRHDFTDELHSVASDDNFADIRKFIDSYKNDRNRLLYASTQGVPRVGSPITNDLIDKRANVFSMLAVYLLIDSHAQQQAFVVQSLDAFLAMVSRVAPQNSGS